MKRLFAIVLIVTLAASSLYAQNGGAAPARDDEALKNELIAAVNAFMQAWEKQDAAALGVTMAPEFCMFLRVESRRRMA